MKISPAALIGCLLLSFLLVLSACQKSDQPAPPPTATPASTPPPPPPPPETSQGTLVKVERAGKTMVRVGYLTTSGIAYDTQQETAAKDKTFVILHFEGKPRRGGARTWLTDGAGKKYWEGMWYASKKVKDQKEKAQVSYEVPSDATGLVWHDGKQPYKLEPVVAALQPEPGKGPAGGKQ